MVPVSHADVLALENEIFLRLAMLRCHNNFPLTLAVFPKGHNAIDIADGRTLLGLTSLEKFGYTRQTAGNILGFRCFSWNLRDGVSWKNIVTIEDGNNRSDREKIGSLHRFIAIKHGNS